MNKLLDRLEEMNTGRKILLIILCLLFCWIIGYLLLAVGLNLSSIINGPGFDPDAPLTDGKNHFGLSNIKACLAAKNCGELQIDSTRGVGTVVTIRIWEGKV